MADVDERAQVLLMAALGMAILFVALALILNTAIYTENLATRGSEVAGGGDAIRYLDTARAGMGGTIAYVNRHNHTSNATLQRNISAAVPAWATASRQQFAHRGRAIDVSLTATKNGTRIEQDDSARNFSDSGWVETWALAENVNGTREFRINVTDNSSLEPSGSGNEFTIEVTGDSNTWSMNITGDGLGNVQVGINNGTGDQFICSSGSSKPWINVTSGTVDNEDCDSLAFSEGVDTPYKLSFDNADNVTGTFTLIVDNNTVARNPGPHLNAGGPSPYAEHAIYSANLSVTYQTPRLFLDTSLRVAPGEPDD